jgi:hypothetical protein
LCRAECESVSLRVHSSRARAHLCCARWRPYARPVDAHGIVSEGPVEKRLSRLEAGRMCTDLCCARSSRRDSAHHEQQLPQPPRDCSRWRLAAPAMASSRPGHAHAAGNGTWGRPRQPASRAGVAAIVARATRPTECRR